LLKILFFLLFLMFFLVATRIFLEYLTLILINRFTGQIEETMDPSELRYLEDDDTPLVKTVKGATAGLVAGTIWGTIVATWYDVPRVERSVALPGLIRTLKMMGNHGLTFAAIGGVYIGVEQLLQNYRMKRDFINGAVGGFAAGATVLGYKDFSPEEYLESAGPSKRGIVCIASGWVPFSHVVISSKQKVLTNRIIELIPRGWPSLGAEVELVGSSKRLCPAGRSISTAISAGAALAVTSALIDAGGQTTRIDNGKEYYPYNTKKRPQPHAN
ncbi:hypothetical protein RJ639_005319, partial [Escallonia herrerae]